MSVRILTFGIHYHCWKNSSVKGGNGNHMACILHLKAIFGRDKISSKASYCLFFIYFLPTLLLSMDNPCWKTGDVIFKCSGCLLPVPQESFRMLCRARRLLKVLVTQCRTSWLKWPFSWKENAVATLRHNNAWAVA